MTPREVELPEAAQRCWPKAVRLVKALSNECATLEDEDWHIGGGTALAADWQHRNSTDIDILIAPGLSMAALGPDGNARIDALIRNQGGVRLQAPDQKLSVNYGPDGKVDIFSSGRQLPGREERITIDKTLTGRLSDAQIFSGKLRRAIEGQAVARDLFDVCYATENEQKGFEQALNTLTKEEQSRIGILWKEAKAKITRDASTKLTGVKKADQIPAEKLAERATKALTDYRYAETIIRAGKGRAVITTLTANGKQRRYESTAGTLKRDFEALGISRYLMRQNTRPQGVMSNVLKHIKEGRTVDIQHIRTPDAAEAHERARANATPRKATTPGGDPSFLNPGARPRSPSNTTGNRGDKGPPDGQPRPKPGNSGYEH